MYDLNNIIVTIVTYGKKERFTYLSKVIKELDSSDCIAGIILVNNGTEYDLESKITDLDFSKKIWHIDLKTNQGSAGGFKAGIEKFISLDYNYKTLLILDDDNLYHTSTFKLLSQLEQKYTLDFPHVWGIYRPAKQSDLFEGSNDKSFSYLENRVGGFSIKAKLFPKTVNVKKKYTDISYHYMTPWGGTIISRDIIEKVGLPDEKFYLYDDDLDYSIRLQKNGVKILIPKEGTLTDLEGSWNENSKHRVQAYFEENSPKFRYLYSLRNNIYSIKKNNLNTNILFYVNIFIFLTITFLLYMPKNKNGFNDFKRLKTAIESGLSGDMGYNESYFKNEG